MISTVDELSLTTRMRNFFKSEGIYTIAQVLKYSETELGRIPNVGKVSIAALQKELLSHGLRLSPDSQWWEAPGPWFEFTL